MPGFDATLGRLFNFTADDLAANGAGRLTPDQEQMWRQSVVASRRGTRRGAMMLVGALAVTAVVAVLAVGVTAGGDVAPLVVVAVMLTLIGLLGWFFIRRGRRDVAALAAGGLRTAEGIFAWDADMNGAWWGRVGDARFGIDRLMEQALTTGAGYRVHYLPMHRSAWVQSIERL